MNVHGTHQGASRFDAAADRIMNLDSVVYGDERERRVVLEASTFGYLLAAYAAYTAAVIAMAFGSVGASIGFALIGGVPAQAATWYARRRGVDFLSLAQRDRAMLRRSRLITGLFAAAWLGAVAFYGVTGHPLFEAEMAHDSSTLWGMVVGAVVGGIVGGLAHRVVGRRRARAGDGGTDADDTF